MFIPQLYDYLLRNLYPDWRSEDAQILLGEGAGLRPPSQEDGQRIVDGGVDRVILEHRPLGHVRPAPPAWTSQPNDGDRPRKTPFCALRCGRLA